MWGDGKFVEGKKCRDIGFRGYKSFDGGGFLRDILCGLVNED